VKFIQLILLILLFNYSYSQKFNSGWNKKLGNNSVTGKYFSSRGIQLYYETYGKGTPLLFLHGNGGSINDFAYQIPYFAKHFKVIAVDSRAHGNSTDSRDSLSYEMMADDFNALLDSLHLDSCYVLGWSDGGIVGLLLSIRHPEKVKKLAITGANLWPDTSAVDPWAYQQTVSEIDSLSKLPVTPEIKNKLKLAKLLLHEPHISIQQLNTITCPTLVMAGDHDVILPKHTLLIAESIPRSTLWILPNCGHATLIRYKDAFNSNVNTFFKNTFHPFSGKDRFY
jgi:pimeloyl-ACP methyl ester carboxylesterase